jgi:hypothetical protein
VILTLTPHIVRNAEITEEDLKPIWVGTENNITFRGGSPRVESDVEGPFDGNEGTPEEIQDAIRRRIQRLPRGLRPEDAGGVTTGGEEGFDEGEAPPPQQPPPGVDLVPVAPPSDAFRNPPPLTEQPTEEPPLEEPPSENLSQNRGASFHRRGPGETEPGSTAVLASLAGGRTSGVRRAATSATGSKASAPVRLWMTPERPTVAPGDTFQVVLQATALREVSHLPLTLTFDPAVLAVEKVEAGDFLGGSAEAQTLSDTSKSGQVVLGLSRLGQVRGVKGTGTLVRITFRALQEGKTEIGFTQSQALDSALRPMVPVDAAPAQVGVKIGAGRPKPVPVPPRREA